MIKKKEGKGKWRWKRRWEQKHFTRVYGKRWWHDDKLFKKYSNGKIFYSFIDEFDRATNEENKKKVVKELKDINIYVEHYAQMEDNYNEYKCKLFGIINAVDYFLFEYSEKWVSGFNWGKHSKTMKYFM